MDNDLDLDFQGHIISYLLAIFLGKKGLFFNIIFFVFMKSTVLRYFLM